MGRLSLLGGITLTRRRYNTGVYGPTGLWIEDASPVDASFQGSLQPVGTRDRQVLPEGLRSAVTLKVYCAPATLRTVDQHINQQADEVIAPEGTFTVVHIDEPHPMLAHQRGYLTRKVEGAA